MLPAAGAAIFDGRQRETWFFGGLAAALVLMRAAVFLIWEHIDFDSDQAIVGLMAKHLSEGRAFPFFFYDQNYMLGVQAWITAPFFLLARPSVAVLKTPLVILNIVAGLLLMRGAMRHLALRPALAFVVALPFLMPAPLSAATFLQTLGSSGVEPLLYILALWGLQSRPLAFGAVLAVGFLHREFTAYALPALLVVRAADGSLFTRPAARHIVRGAAGFALAWVILDYIRLHVDGLSLFLQAEMLGKHACVALAEVPARLRYVFDTGFTALIGGTPMTLNAYGLRSSATVGSRALGWIVCGGLVLMIARLAWLWATTRVRPDASWAVYLMVAGACTLGAYSLTCTLSIGSHPTLRYMNLALLLPIGCFAAFITHEPLARLRTAAVALFLLWGAVNLVDQVRVLQAAVQRPEANPHRELTSFLLDHQMRYARADYWDAYVVAFYSRERIIAGSYGPARIPEYERLVDANRDTAVGIQRMPCEGWRRVAAWCVQLPARLEAPR